ncbi:carboxylic acid transporter [Penicillium argentinense]|uniref:Carboxylic acid transporter n=1 Tax=Penicillium argentinense TaxID=1131581 RepID=A0A9W9F7I0_9EURO|nr:carboxylic acid transporter [Penicillium argentinense]KAJ5094924.1 carboxylic acid transporter [Penicillium argentinense]
MRNYMAAGWFYSPSQIGRYSVTRITSLKPPKNKIRNPVSVVRELTTHQWLMFFVGFLGWTWDAFDFFTVSLTVTEIAQDFDVSVTSVTWGITVTLMLRSVGALASGFFADRYGRKWPFIINLCFFIILELGSGFCQNLRQFLGVRALYGIAMGGLFGSAAATALEDLPYDARGVLSGFFEMGYAIGYLLAAAMYPPPVLIILFRLMLPETNYFQVMVAEREERSRQMQAENDQAHVTGFQSLLKYSRAAFKENWVLFIYLVILMTGFNACSHGSQDFYPTFLKDQVGFNANQVTIITVVGQAGAFAGANFFGYISTFFGRRSTMMVTCVIGGALVPSYVLPRDMSLIATVFWEQFCVGGVWGPIPIHLMEVCPPEFRSLMVGFTYQLGNLASSASATIQSTIGSKYPLPPTATNHKRFDYGTVMGIFLGAVWAYILFFLFWGPEMSAEERDDEAEAAKYLEQRRAEGASLAEIGVMRARGLDKLEGQAHDNVENGKEAFTEHVEC